MKIANHNVKTYAERNKGKMRLYRITQLGGTHTRLERTEGGELVSIRYAFGTKHNQIQLTPAGAKALSHLALDEVKAAIGTTGPARD